MKTNTKLFWKLLGASLVTTLMVLPYTLALSPAVAKLFTPTVLAAQIIQSLVLFAIAIFFGLKLAGKTGFQLPVWEGKEGWDYIKKNLGLSVGLGVLAGVLIILFSFLFGQISGVMLGAETGAAWWMRLMASFYGGIGEEILFRLFILTLFAWVFMKITRAKKLSIVGFWTANILTGVLFGLGHLPITGAVTAITAMVVARAILLNGVGAVIFGWLYWKKGLEAAMIAHFAADIVIHLITPAVAFLVMQ